MSKDPEHRFHIFQYIYSVKERLVVHRKKVLALILTIASIIATIYAAFVGIVQLQPVIQSIEEHSNFFQVIASFALVITSAYFSSKMYMNAIRMSKKPAIVELFRDLILPLEENLQEKKKYYYTTCYIPYKCSDELPFSSFTRFLKALSAEFYSILNEINKKEKWDQEVDRFYNSCEELNSRIDELKKKLKEFTERHMEEIKKRYEKELEWRKKCGWMEEEYSDFQTFLDKLIDEFYEFHVIHIKREKKLKYWREDSSWSMWISLDDIAEKIEQELSHDLEEIDRIRRERDRHIDNLISLLEEVREYIRKEYNLTPSELGWHFRWHLKE
jgi:DNA repair exonuclease SbcCD ATPase subunit